ncbi:NAD(P)H-binding protein [Streptomyces sp. SP18BB07]|uniref:NAD(P)H-binding protein n=1 Tax=Streptomyces sp. SP18BB07 TaxID=3002522 RepID=UPI002E762F82|nr:NAD(P)H-binding protein [Streptomyces sp. SP18BB07]MEE1765212.1 NAD(P)H-binding protein [Streptomyces sp. SP18BB07]
MVAGADAMVLTLGSFGTGASSPETVDYAGVRNVLTALASLDGARPRVALMTSIGATTRSSSYGHLLEWKRRSERLVRASGLTFTIVRPGWFDMNGPDEHQLVFLQGDRRRTCRARRHRTGPGGALTALEAAGRTFELVAEQGAAPSDLGSLFAALDQDPPGSLDAVRDEANMPLDAEPQRVRDDLDAVRERAAA